MSEGFKGEKKESIRTHEEGGAELVEEGTAVEPVVRAVRELRLREVVRKLLGGA